MENEIVGEKLKGMHLAIQSLSSRHFLEEKLGSEIQGIATIFSKVSEAHSALVLELGTVCKEKDKLQEDLIENNALMSELRADRDKIGTSAKDRILSLKAELDQARDERDRCKAELLKMEKKYKDLGDEHDKMRQKLKHFRLKRKQYGEGEEKLCRKCQKTFLESENFNWSCRTHKAEFGGEMWWCCGRGKDAPGCLVSKHQSKDEDEDNEPRDQEENEQRQIANLRCPVTLTQSCKVLGHKASDCPKDPNIRSTFDIEEELKRIVDIRLRKKQESSFEMNQLIATVYREKLRSDAYEIGYGSSPSSSYASSEEEEEERAPPATNFPEILELKTEVGNVSPSRTLVQVAQFTSKDAEKEQLMNKRISLLPGRTEIRKETFLQRKGASQAGDS